ncbi:MAG TPA: TonB-dependent receptor plug domain-containing protein, partial [Candidatus Didemnitutus sp.]|nr:TonB-dependent receptor plug domain-containing protein [Candidatus Didemnitutus sp.]
MKNRQLLGYNALLAALLAFATGASAQQNSPTKPKDADTKDETPVFQLSPFEVVTDSGGYTSATTLAGNHLNTEVRDIGNAVTVITAQFMKDIGATDNQTLLQYTTNTEVGNVYGNFAGAGDAGLLDESPHFINPNTNTRVRGLTAADNTRDYFLTDIPWDSYNVDGVDLQRGPNSILFGQGSPAGIINTRTKPAMFKNSNQVEFRFDQYGSARLSVDFNRMLLKDELSLRVAAVTDDTKYKQDPAYSKSDRLFGALRYEPGFLKKGSARTIIKGDIEWGNIKSNNPRQLPPIDLITPWFYTGTYKGVNIEGKPFDFPNLNKMTLIPSQNEDDNTNLPNHGQNRPAHNGAPIAGTANQYYQPWVGNFGNQFGNPTIMFNSDNTTAQTPYTLWEPRGNHGIGPNGQVDQGVGG